MQITKESVYKALENNEKGLTYKDIQCRFFGANGLTQSEDDALFYCLQLNMEEDKVFLEYTISTEKITFFSEKYRSRNNLVK